MAYLQAFEPIYRDLAKKLRHDNQLVVAKFDATANDLPANFAVEGFPTIYLASASKKSQPIRYEGGRTAEEVMKFLKENAEASFQKSEL